MTYEIVGGPRDGARIEFPDALLGARIQIPERIDRYHTYRVGYGVDCGKLFFEGFAGVTA